MKLRKGEEQIVKKIHPDYFDPKKSKSEDIVIFVRSQLHELLNSFLNGGFSNTGFVLFPLVKDLSKENKRLLIQIKESVEILTSKGHNFLKTLEEFEGDLTSHSCARIISALYQDLDKIQSKDLRTENKPKCKQITVKSYKDKKTSGAIASMQKYANKNLRKYLKNLYLHGSLGTNDYIKGWSDCDTISIVSKETIDSPKKLLRLRNKLYRFRKFFLEIDPLQHHGTICIAEYELDNYSQAYFPVAVYKYGKSFFSDTKISFKVRDSKKEVLRDFFWFLTYFRNLKKNKKFRLNSYDTKVLLHSITLFPTIYLAAKGQYMYKKFSFDKAEQDFSSNEWEIIDVTSLLRKDWMTRGNLPFVAFLSRINPLLAYQLNFRILDYFGNIRNINRINAEKFILSMNVLYESAWKKIQKNVKV